MEPANLSLCTAISVSDMYFWKFIVSVYVRDYKLWFTGEDKCIIWRLGKLHCPHTEHISPCQHSCSLLLLFWASPSGNRAFLI